MKLCRFTHGSSHDARIGLADGDHSVIDLTPAGVTRMFPILESEDPVGAVRKLALATLPRIPVGSVKFLAPVEEQEVWAAGVTYLRSKTARMEESDFSASAYDRVYEAARPEIFFKSMPEKVVATGDGVGIRKDATWNVPEPEFTLVMNSHGRIVGCTIGNDMSSRDIEGENLLYLPQAKTYYRSCAAGPWILLGTEAIADRNRTIHITISRDGAAVFTGETKVSQIKRSFEELAGYLFRSQVFAHGALLLTGTGIVPADTFTLQAGDVVRIEIEGIGVLENPVVVV
jgi:2-dehydro-3-deoxy-D-arabinonate dehydratase